MLAAARKLWRAPLLVLQHSSLLSTATCNSFAPTAQNRGAPDVQKLIKLADCNILGKQRYALRLSAQRKAHPGPKQDVRHARDRCVSTDDSAREALRSEARIGAAHIYCPCDRGSPHLLPLCRRGTPSPRP